MSHLSWHFFTFEYFTWVRCSTVRTCMTMVFRTVSHRSSGLSMSFDCALETFTFADCSCVNFVSCCKNIAFDFLSECHFFSTFQFKFSYESFVGDTSFIKVSFNRFVNKFFSLVSETNLYCTVTIIVLCFNLCYHTWTSLQYSYWS